MVDYNQEDWFELNKPYYDSYGFGTLLSDESTVLKGIGSKDVLICCSTSVKRRNRGKIFPSHYLLGAVSEVVATESNSSYVIRRAYPKGVYLGDDSEFAVSLRETIRQSKSQVVLILLGLKIERGDMVQICTNDGRYCHGSVLESLTSVLEKYNMNYVVDKDLFAHGADFFNEFVEEFPNINFIGIGIPRVYRNIECIESCNEFVNMLVDFVNYV